MSWVYKRWLFKSTFCFVCDLFQIRSIQKAWLVGIEGSKGGQTFGRSANTAIQAYSRTATHVFRMVMLEACGVDPENWPTGGTQSKPINRLIICRCYIFSKEDSCHYSVQVAFKSEYVWGTCCCSCRCQLRIFFKGSKKDAMYTCTSLRRLYDHIGDRTVVCGDGRITAKQTKTEEPCPGYTRT